MGAMVMELKRDLRMRDVVSISCGAMLSGLFILPGMAYLKTGPSILSAFLVAALLAITGMLSQAELVSAMPKAGGAYFFVSRSMGPTVGTIYGLITWLSLCLKSAVELLACAAFAAFLFPVNPQLLAFVLCALFIGINLVGVKEAGKVQVAFIAVILSALLLLCFMGYSSIDVENLTPFVQHGRSGILAAAGFMFMAFGGLLKVASIAEEVAQPGRVIPRAMIFSLMIVLVTYLTVIFMVIGVLDPAVIAGSKTPISDAAGIFMGNPGAIAFSMVAILAILSAANAGIMAASRYPLALSRDGLFPGCFGRINQRFNTPHVSLFVTGVLIVASIFMRLEVIVKMASSVLILTYMFSCISAIIMRESRLMNYQPEFKSPLYPWVQIVGIIGFSAILLYMGSEVLLLGLVLGLLAFVLYWYYHGTETDREFALLHLIERITSRDLTGHMLETELREILHERDQILKDSFDHLVDECSVIDIERSITKEELFYMVSQEMAPHLHHSREEIMQRLIDRENESSTALNPYLAIPHIIIDGEKSFDMLLFRCKEGVMFSHDTAHVHAVFVLIGTQDMRQMHLTSLAAIAQIVQDADFEKRWMAAKSEEALRDIILLSKRKRQVEA